MVIASVLVLLGGGWTLVNAPIAWEMSAALSLGLALLAASLFVTAAGLMMSWRWSRAATIVFGGLVMLFGAFLLITVRDAPALGMLHLLYGATLAALLLPGHRADLPHD